MANKVKVVLIGGTGYGGAEILRRLLFHPNVEVIRITAVDNIGKKVGDVHLNLAGLTDLSFQQLAPAEAVAGADVTFLAMPHKTTAQVVMEILASGTRIVDLSGDFRLRDPAAYAKYYGVTHPAPQHLTDGTFVYGMPELNREAIRKAKYVASPGCFATTIALGVMPLAKGGKLRGAIHTVAATGSSGSGANPQITTHHPLRANNLKTYKVLNHQHTPEIEQTLRLACTRAGQEPAFSLAFVPVSAPLVRGILATTFVPLASEHDAKSVATLFENYYRESTFVRVLGSKVGAEVVAVKGSMYVDLSWNLGAAADGLRQLVVTTALDNLVKGGAGQAVQSMNLMFGFPEGQGIDAPAMWP